MGGGCERSSRPSFLFLIRRKKRIADASEEARCTALPAGALGTCDVCVCAPILFASIRRMFFRPHFLFSFRKGNGVEPPKEKMAWGNLSNGFPTPLLATASEEARCTALPADAESSVSACSFFLSKPQPLRWVTVWFRGSALGTCCVWKSEMHDGISERRCAERRDLSGGRDGWDRQRKTEIF